MAKEHNFGFLSKIDKNLYNIANDAELLYCDEFFDQCIVQTRRFAENVCRNITKGEFSSEETFDEILATLKDRMNIFLKESRQLFCSFRKNTKRRDKSA